MLGEIRGGTPQLPEAVVWLSVPCEKISDPIINFIHQYSNTHYCYNFDGEFMRETITHKEIQQVIYSKFFEKSYHHRILKLNQRYREIQNEFYAKSSEINANERDPAKKSVKLTRLLIWFWIESDKAARKYLGHSTGESLPKELLKKIKLPSLYEFDNDAINRPLMEERMYEDTGEKVWMPSDWWVDKIAEYRAHYPPKKCEFCTDEFLSSRDDQKYCCVECRYKAFQERRKNDEVKEGKSHQKKIMRFCIMCGKPFKTKSSLAKTCSGACRVAFSRNRGKEKITSSASRP